MDAAAPPVEIVAPAEKDGGRITFPTYLKTGPRCPPHAPDEIVVCAEDPEQFRLRPLPDKFGEDDTVPRAQKQLNERMSVGAELESAGVGGHVSNRVMVRGRIKF